MVTIRFLLEFDKFYLAEDLELLRLRLLFVFSLDSREMDLDRLTDFLDNERLLDLLERDLLLLLDFFKTGDTDFFCLCGDLETERFVFEADRNLKYHLNQETIYIYFPVFLSSPKCCVKIVIKMVNKSTMKYFLHG